MKFNTIKKLYRGEFQYNIVLKLATGELFKGRDKSKYTERFNRLPVIMIPNQYQMELPIISKLYEYIMNMENFATRYEYPRLTIHTNNYDDITAIRELMPEQVRSIGLPPAGLEPGMIYMPDTPYDFRITLGEVTKFNLEFIEWATDNKNIRLQPKTKKLLSLSPSRHYNSGSQLYVKGERNLVFVKMHLSNIKLTIDRILN